jgi:hypothetical protein
MLLRTVRAVRRGCRRVLGVIGSLGYGILAGDPQVDNPRWMTYDIRNL